MNPCYASCCDNEAVDEHRPYCSPECQRLTRLVQVSGNYTPKKTSGTEYIPPPVAPFAWLDARAETTR